MATYETVTCHTRVYVRVCTRVIKLESTLLRIFDIPLCTYALYTRQFPLIFVMWDYLNVFNCAGDVALSGVSDLRIKRRSSIFT